MAKKSARKEAPDAGRDDALEAAVARARELARELEGVLTATRCVKNWREIVEHLRTLESDFYRTSRTRLALRVVETQAREETCVDIRSLIGGQS